MKRFLKRGAAALSLVVAATQAWAEGPPSAAGAPQLPQSLRGMMTLGRAGLLPEYFSNDQFGTVQGRIADMRVTTASAHSPGAPQTGYEDGGHALVLAPSYMKLLSDGKSALRFAFSGTKTDGNPGIIEINADILRFDAQYIRFPSTRTMLSFGLFGESSKAEVVGAGDLERKGYGLRADVLHQMSDHWGLVARAEYSFGQSKGALNTPFGLLTRSQGDDRFYTHALLVGAIPQCRPCRRATGLGAASADRPASAAQLYRGNHRQFRQCGLRRGGQDRDLWHHLGQVAPAKRGRDWRMGAGDAHRHRA